MIELLTGVPGSGKTYFAVERLIKAYEKKDRPIFTNINLTVPFDDVLQPLDVKEFHEFCQKEFDFYEHFRDIQSQKRKDDPDFDESDNYDEALKKSGLLEKFGNALIFWDECHNDLDNRDPAFVRWMSYHRHFEGMDVLLITQNLSLIDRKYKAFIDKFYFGVNASKRLLSTTFKYNVYTDHRQYEKYWIETISLPSNKKVFSFYDSGHYKVNKSAAIKKLAPILGMAIFLALFAKYFLFGYILHRNDDKSKELEQNSSVITADDPTRELMPEDNRSVDQMKHDALQDNNAPLLAPPPLVADGSQGVNGNMYQNGSRASLSRYLLRFQCTQSYCYFSGNRFTIPLNAMAPFFKKFGGEILAAEPFTRDISVITALVPSELYYMIESHNIVSRSDNYGPQSQNSNFQNSSFQNSNYGFYPSSNNAGLSSPQFAPTSGF